MPGTRTDPKRTCLVCGRLIRAGNLRRHLIARHPDSRALADVLAEDLRRLVGDVADGRSR